MFDASAKGDDKSPSLNDCLETGPSLQNLIWDILVRNRMQAVMLSGELKQAFLQIRIRQHDGDALRFHWPKDRHLQKIQVYRFTRAMWGLNQSSLCWKELPRHILMTTEKSCQRKWKK